MDPHRFVRLVGSIPRSNNLSPGSQWQFVVEDGIGCLHVVKHNMVPVRAHVKWVGPAGRAMTPT